MRSWIAPKEAQVYLTASTRTAQIGGGGEITEPNWPTRHTDVHNAALPRMGARKAARKTPCFVVDASPPPPLQQVEPGVLLRDQQQVDLG